MLLLELCARFSVLGSDRFSVTAFALAGHKPADQGPRGQLCRAACEPAEGVEQLPGEEGRHEAFGFCPR